MSDTYGVRWWLFPGVAHEAPRHSPAYHTPLAQWSRQFTWLRRTFGAAFLPPLRRVAAQWRTATDTLTDRR